MSTTGDPNPRYLKYPCNDIAMAKIPSRQLLPKGGINV